MKRLFSIWVVVTLLVFNSNVFAQSVRDDDRALEAAARLDRKLQNVDNFNDMISKGIFYGTQKTAWFTKDFENPKRQDFNTFAIGGHIHARSAAWYGLSLGVGFYTVQDLGLNGRNGVFPKLIATDDKGYSTSLTALGEYYANLNISKTNIKIGAQELVTPWFKKYDIQRVLPSNHQGIYINSKELDGIEFILGYIDKVRDNVSPTFVSPASLVDGVPKGIDRGIFWSELKYTGIKGLRLHGAYHLWDDIFYNAFLDARYSYKVKEDLDWFAAFRGAYQQATGLKLSKNPIDSYLYGGYAGIKFNGFTVLGIYSKIGPNDLAPWWDGIGVLNIMQVIPAYRAEEVSYRLDMYYELGRIIPALKGMELGGAYAIFDTPDSGPKKVEDRNEFDLDLAYYFPGPLKGWNIRLRYANIKGSSSPSTFTQQDLRALLTYRF